MTGRVDIESRAVDPRRLADITLAAAVRAAADAVYIEPAAKSEETYTVSFERGGKVLTSLSIEALTGAATVARLAYIANMDLASAAAQSAVVPVRSGDREADLVLTVRPGRSLRADIMVLTKRHATPGRP